MPPNTQMVPLLISLPLPCVLDPAGKNQEWKSQNPSLGEKTDAQSFGKLATSPSGTGH